jgi:nucleoside-diphosphate-sugar epimerase
VPTALVTGASGLVGSHVVERFLADGWDVRALTRDPVRARWLERPGVTLCAGDVLDPPSLARAAAGCDAIVHAAAEIIPERGGEEAILATNVQGTRHVIDAAAGAAGRLIHVSSVAVYGASARYREGAPTDESAPLPPSEEGTPYARSKRASEAIVLEAHASGRVWASAVRPCVIYGPRDRQFVPRMARVIRTGFFPIVGGGHTTLSLVHAANVADGIVRAASTDAAGGRAYNLANDFPISARDFPRLAASGLGRRIHLIPLPLSLARAGLALMKGALIASGRRSAAQQSGGAVSFLSRDNPFSSERARRELGWAPPMRHEDGVPAAFAWVKERAT